MTESVSNRTQVLNRLAQLIATKTPPHPLRVAIDGRTAAGKTTLANELVAPLERLGRNVIRVEIDDFHLPLAIRHGRQDLPPWQQYYRDSYDLAAIRRDLLLPLGPDGNRRYRRAIFDSLHDTPIDEPTRLAPPDAVVLVDGVFLLRPELVDLWDLRMYVDIDADDSLQRGPSRDVAWVGSIDRAESRYLTTYIPGEDVYATAVAPRRRADVVIDNRNLVRPTVHIRR